MDKDALFARATELGLNPDKRWGEDRLRKAIEEFEANKPTEGAPPSSESKSAAPSEPAAVAIVPAETPAQEPVPTLSEYIKQVESKHVKRDVFAVEVSHPNGEQHVRPCTYGGIRIKKGPLGVRYSDGTTE